MLRYYKVPLVDGIFQGVNYDDVVEGIAFEKHSKDGYGYIAMYAEYPFEEVSEEAFDVERRG